MIVRDKKAGGSVFPERMVEGGNNLKKMFVVLLGV
jgi:hypothetical protein